MVANWAKRVMSGLLGVVRRVTAERGSGESVPEDGVGDAGWAQAPFAASSTSST